jgi:glyoxylase-like metal-dependent hydrolase (beta-lactamase superfamily II)
MTRVSLAMMAAAIGLSSLATQPAWSANVRITPLGSHEGEFCRNDRALIFEDPDGTRLLYDAGRTVRGPEDERLGEVDAVLLSHVHSDHLGDAHQSGPEAGTCAEPDRSVSVTPNSNTVNIVVAKDAKLLVGG